MKFEFTKEQLNILKTFLNRVQLEGREVQAFIEVGNIFNKPLEEKKKDK